ncbi:MFS transporter [Amorphus orientalis]|uniref:EmrB/QacA subfamily drug resistance transporter n=1 Tax=Amorphus orientalis TaxID=649198 RepID=A0AAE3VSC6_9HYPH|nr:MFS transporter [Amorphus orientalis]MDQ0317302.1 EmrB/QacA subfamily drug resistance transporter [Amorphus orientalis]
MTNPTPRPDIAQPPGEAEARRAFFAIFPALILPIFLAVVDQTIVATALPAIAASMGEVDRLSWVVVSYLVAATICAPVYGRLGDHFGRRRLMFVALAVYMCASLLCAVSWSIEMLTLARVLQGFGGGGLMTLAQAIVGETVAPRERARYQGYIATVAVTSSTFGPVAGGLLTQYFGWQSVFLINLPLGVLAGLLALRLPKSKPSDDVIRFDGIGLFWFAAFISAVLIMLEQAEGIFLGQWGLPAGLFVVAVLAVVFLIRREHRTSDPLLPLSILRKPAVWRADCLAVCHGGMLVSLITFLPFYLRVAHGTSASSTGLLLLPLTAGIGLGSMVTGRIVGRTGKTAIFPSVGLTCAVVVLVFLALTAEHLTAGELSVVFGVLSISLGTVMGVVQLTVQMGSGTRQLGAGAATVQFSRSLGAAAGTALVGTVLFSTLAISNPQAGAAFAELVQAGPEALASIPADQRVVIEQGLEAAFRNAFLCIGGFALIAAWLAWTLPLRRV